MGLTINTMMCCACRQMTNLHTYKKNAKKAMLDLCTQEFHRDHRFNGTTFVKNMNKFTKIFTFYVFNGIVSYKEGSVEDTTANRAGLGYVEAFRDFIRENDLGRVVESKTGWNRTGGPTHNILVCIWQPKPRKLRAWYNKNRPTPRKKSTNARNSQ